MQQPLGVVTNGCLGSIHFQQGEALAAQAVGRVYCIMREVVPVAVLTDGCTAYVLACCGLPLP